MATIFKILPVDSTPARKITTTVNDQVIKIRSYYNTIDGGWFFDLYDVEDNPLVLGVAAVTGMELLYPYPKIDLGQLAYISSENGEGGGKYDFGNTAKLILGFD